MSKASGRADNCVPWRPAILFRLCWTLGDEVVLCSLAEHSVGSGGISRVSWRSLPPNLKSNGLRPISNGLQPSSNGLQPSSNGCFHVCFSLFLFYRFEPFAEPNFKDELHRLKSDYAFSATVLRRSI